MLLHQLHPRNFRLDVRYKLRECRYLGHFLALIIFALMMGVSHLLIQQSLSRLEVQSERLLSETSLLIRTRLEMELNTAINLTQGLAVYTALHPNMTNAEFDLFAQRIYAQAPFIRNIAYAQDTQVKFVYPLAGNEKALGLQYLTHPTQKDSVLRMLRNKQAFIAGPVNLVQGGVGVICRLPIYADDAKDHYLGLISVVLDFDKLAERTGLMDEHLNLQLALRGKDGLGFAGEVFFGDPQMFSQQSYLTSIQLATGNWVLATQFKPSPHATSESPLPYWFFASFIALFLAFLTLALVKSYQRNYEFASKDPLTGLWNRRVFEAFVEQKILNAQRNGQSFRMIFVDLDGFKQINDEYGHKVGDEVLIATAQRLTQRLRKSDVVARLGGDEFVVLLDGVAEENTPNKLMEELKENTHFSHKLSNGKTISVKASIGCAAFPDDAQNLDQLLHLADQAMYAQKHQDKNPT